MRIFEYSGITESIPTDIAETIAKIESLRAMDPIREDVYLKELSVAKEACRSSSTESSCSLEWINEENGSLQMEGYLNAMDMLGNHSLPIDLTEGSLLTLHSTILNGSTRKESRYRLRDSESDRRDIHVNSIRPVPAQSVKMSVEQMVASYTMARDVGIQSILLAPILNGSTRKESRYRLRDSESDRRDIHVNSIRPVPAQSVKMSVEQMVASYTMARDVGIQSILLAPSMILDFLNIRPFHEGNWRMSRLMLIRLLIDSGYRGLEISSLESHMEASSEDYYDAVAESSAGWNNNGSDPYPFIRFVTDMVLECYEEVSARYPLDCGRKVKKGERIARIVEWSDHPLSKTEICNLLPDISRRTTDVVLSQLMADGRIVKIGTFRDARYAPTE